MLSRSGPHLQPEGTNPAIWMHARHHWEIRLLQIILCTRLHTRTFIKEMPLRSTDAQGGMFPRRTRPGRDVPQTLGPWSSISRLRAPTPEEEKRPQALGPWPSSMKPFPTIHGQRKTPNVTPSISMRGTHPFRARVSRVWPYAGSSVNFPSLGCLKRDPPPPSTRLLGGAMALRKSVVVRVGNRPRPK